MVYYSTGGVGAGLTAGVGAMVYYSSVGAGSATGVVITASATFFPSFRP